MCTLNRNIFPASYSAPFAFPSPAFGCMLPQSPFVFMPALAMFTN